MDNETCPVGLDCEHGKCVGRELCTKAREGERKALDKVFDTIASWRDTEPMSLDWKG